MTRAAPLNIGEAHLRLALGNLRPGWKVAIGLLHRLQVILDHALYVPLHTVIQVIVDKLALFALARVAALGWCKLEIATWVAHTYCVLLYCAIKVGNRL